MFPNLKNEDGRHQVGHAVGHRGAVVPVLLRHVFVETVASTNAPRWSRTDKSMIARTKYNRGSRLFSRTKWIFGICDPMSKVGYAEMVPNCSAQTLRRIIRRVVVPGTEIWTDEWWAYRMIGQMGLGYVHRTVNYSRHFRDPSPASAPTTWRRIGVQSSRPCTAQGPRWCPHVWTNMWLEHYCRTLVGCLQLDVAYFAAISAAVMMAHGAQKPAHFRVRDLLWKKTT